MSRISTIKNSKDFHLFADMDHEVGEPVYLEAAPYNTWKFGPTEGNVVIELTPELIEAIKQIDLSRCYGT